ncbi:hypothetical protein [Nocardia terpenica]|nr:hypothetical protein [Nocardia terpenica]
MRSGRGPAAEQLRVSQDSLVELRALLALDIRCAEQREGGQP